MPLKSVSQIKKIKELEETGKVPKGTLEKWVKETKNFGSLPDRVPVKQKIKVIKRRRTQ